VTGSRVVHGLTTWFLAACAANALNAYIDALLGAPAPYQTLSAARPFSLEGMLNGLLVFALGLPMLLTIGVLAWGLPNRFAPVARAVRRLSGALSVGAVGFAVVSAIITIVIVTVRPGHPLELTPGGVLMVSLNFVPAGLAWALVFWLRNPGRHSAVDQAEGLSNP